MQKNSKRIILILLLSLLAIHNVQAAEKQSNSDTCVSYKVTTAKLNVRAGPAILSKVIGTVKQDDIVCVDSFTGKWGKTDNGWVSKKYLLRADKKNNSESYLWYEIVFILILMGLFFAYWKIILTLGIAGFVIIAVLGINIWYVMAGILAIFLLYQYFSCSGYKCPKCKTCVKEYSTRKLVEEHYEHATKTGLPDKRYSDNPLISTYRDTYKCSNEECNNVFKIDVVEKS